MQETIKNLAKAFAGESQARNRYTFYAKQAREEGYEQIAAIFEETANQEKQHAKQLMKMINELKGNDASYPAIQIEAEVPNVLATTTENLKAAIGGENFEYVTMYPEFAETAEKEGLPKVAARLRAIARAEEHHEERYKSVLELVETGTYFKREEEVSWVCRECGYVHTGKTAPGICPSCDHPTAFYQVKSEVY